MSATEPRRIRTLVARPATALAGAEWVSPEWELGFAARDAVPSWNASTPTGTGIDVELRVRSVGGGNGGRWGAWRRMAHWASHSPLERTSFDAQPGPDGSVDTDVFRSGDHPFDAVQTRVRATTAEGAPHPVLALVAVVAAAGEPLPAPSEHRIDAVDLDVPPLSQSLHRGELPEYGGGGEAWCSPTSTTMVRRFWGRRAPADAVAELARARGDRPGDAEVPYAAMGCFDAAYEGTGNWSFNAAYAGSDGLEAIVTRLASLDEAAGLLREGVPLVASVRYTREELPEAGYGTAGHLLVIRGIDVSGDVIVNDPASPTADAVRRVYPRRAFEEAWLGRTGGLVYLIRSVGPDRAEELP